VPRHRTSPRPCGVDVTGCERRRLIGRGLQPSQLGRYSKEFRRKAVERLKARDNIVETSAEWRVCTAIAKGARGTDPGPARSLAQVGRRNHDRNTLPEMFAPRTIRREGRLPFDESAVQEGLWLSRLPARLLVAFDGESHDVETRARVVLVEHSVNSLMAFRPPLYSPSPTRNFHQVLRAKGQLLLLRLFLQSVISPQCEPMVLNHRASKPHCL
jgi:hypothetical protein